MPWVKTDAGRAEIQSRSVVAGRAQRNLLLLIDGKRSEAQLISSVSGIGMADIYALSDLGLIASVAQGFEASSSFPTQPPSSIPPNSVLPTLTTPVLMNGAGSMHIDIPVDVLPMPNYAHVSKALTGLIASELGLRGLTLTLAVEKAADLEQLMGVAERVVKQILSKKGIAAADKARRAIYGA